MAFSKAVVVVLAFVGVYAQDTVYTSLVTSGTDAGIYADPCRQDAGAGGPVRPCQTTDAKGDMTAGSTLLLASSYAAVVDLSTQTITVTGSNFPIPADIRRVQLAKLKDRLPTAAGSNLADCQDSTKLDLTSFRLVATAATSSSISFQLQKATATDNGWFHGDLAAPLDNEWERRPVGLCISFDEATAPVATPNVKTAAVTGAYKYTGLKVKVVADCDPTAETGDTSCQAGAAYSSRGQYLDLSSAIQRHLKGKTTCCKSTVNFGVGQCINGKQATCCGAAFATTVQSTTDQKRAERCCNAERHWVSGDAWTNGCPCRNENKAKNADCPAGEQCCVQSKFPEQSQTVGVCYNANFRGCCDDGNIFDPVTEQCCAVDGKQTRDTQCSCDDDADCAGKCCKQTSPALPASYCNKYAVWGSKYEATSDADKPGYINKICRGNCIDPTYQLCCNGAVAIREYERCCDGASYNLFTQTCTDGRTVKAASNYGDFRVLTKKPSTIEALNVLRSFWIFVLPTLLLLGTLGSLALVLVFANKASSRSYSFVEGSMIFFACTSLLFALPLFFSPSYKYGIVLVVMALLTVLTAAARVRLLNAVCVLVQLLVLLYVFDPFAGNNFVNFQSYRTKEGRNHRDAAGLFHTLDLQWRDLKEDGDRFCPSFYDFFELDNNLRDVNRFDNGEIETFGYCSRAFTFALLVFAALSVLALLLLFIMTIVALLLRFRKPEDPVVELQVVPSY